MNAYRDQYAQLFRNGRNVVLIAISADQDTAQASWARDAEFPYLFASDTGSVVGKQYGAYLGKYKLDNRTLFVIAPDGKINYVGAVPRDRSDVVYDAGGGDQQRSGGLGSSAGGQGGQRRHGR